MIERIDNLLKRYRQFTELTLSEIQTLFSALLLLPIIAILLRIKGFGWTQIFSNRFISEKSHPTNSNPTQLRKAQDIAKLVSIAADHGPYRANCLKKSLVIWWLLSRRGIQSNIKIGVNKDDGDFNAHAWVEFQGIILNDLSNINKQFSVLLNE